MMDHTKVVSDLNAARKNSPELFDSREGRAREALKWAIANTCLALPHDLRRASGWRWDADNVRLRVLTGDGEFRFHVAGERRGPRKIRIAVMSWENNEGKATWEADMPAEKEAPDA